MNDSAAELGQHSAAPQGTTETNSMEEPAAQPAAQFLSGSAGDTMMNNSIYIGNVDYSATPVELEEHFRACGPIARITILTDRLSGKPKGYAYLEFKDRAAATAALQLHESTFHGRTLKVNLKRRNIRGFNRPRAPASQTPYPMISHYNPGYYRRPTRKFSPEQPN